MPRVVLFNALGIVGGGQETRARELLKRWRKYDNHSRLIVVRNQGQLAGCSDANDLEILERPYRLGRLNALDRLTWENFILPLQLKRLGVDAYLSFSHYLPKAFPRSVRSVMGVSNLAPFSQDAYDLEKGVVASLRLRMLRQTIVASARRADRVVALSSVCARILVTHGIDAAKIVVLPNGVAAAPSATAPVDLEHDEPYLLYVSNFWRYKNFEVVVRAFARLPADIKEKYRLLLVGYPYDKLYYSEIAALIAALGLGSRVSLIPGRSSHELAQLYEHAQLFVFASLIENSPNIVLEAMSRGAPLLLSSAEPMPEFGGDAARYFDPKSPDDLAATMAMMLSDPQLLMAMRQASVARSALYSWDRFVQSIVELVHH